MKKLTLSAEPDVIRQAKSLARKNRTSVSAMFTRMIRMMAPPAPAPGTPVHSEPKSQDRPRVPRPRALGPITRKATGLITMPANKTDRQVLEDALADKYRLGQ